MTPFWMLWHCQTSTVNPQAKCRKVWLGTQPPWFPSWGASVSTTKQEKARVFATWCTALCPHHACILVARTVFGCHDEEGAASNGPLPPTTLQPVVQEQTAPPPQAQ